MWGAVGLDTREARVYEELMRKGHDTAASVAMGLGFSAAQVTSVLTRLARQGIVTRLPGRPVRFAAVAPEEVAASLIAEREQQLLQLRTHARELADVHRRANVAWQHPADLVEVIEGSANVRNAFRRLQQDAQHEFCGFDRPPHLNDPLQGNAEESRRLTTDQITYRVIYDPASVAMPGRMTDVWNVIRIGEQARVAEVPMKLALCDDRAALIPVATVDSDRSIDAAYLIRPSSLLDALCALFEVIWQRAVPLNRAPNPDTAGNPSIDDVNLIGLLAAGNTDERIARSLGWHVRTVSRHVQRLMQQVGAQTRFQLGMEAARRRWI